MNIIRTLGFAAALVLPLAGTAAAQNASDYIREPVRIDKTFDQTLAGGCKYTVDVSGTVTPEASPDAGAAQIPIVTPHVAVSAQTVCPTTAAVKVTDDTLGTGPLTWKQLEDSISSRSHVVTVEKTHRCTYGAVFQVVDRQLQVNHFDHACQAL